MKVTILTEKEYDLKYLWVSAEVRYWEDAKINGVEDTEGTLTPCRKGNAWEPWIELETGVIKDWPHGTTADIHFKVCDAGIYTLVDQEGRDVLTVEDYVPKCLCPEEAGYGDYIIMVVEGNGHIRGWKPWIDDLIGDRN